MLSPLAYRYIRVIRDRRSLYRGSFPYILLKLLPVQRIFIAIPGTSLYRGSLYRGSTVIQESLSARRKVFSSNPIICACDAAGG